ncbi:MULTISPECIES: ABC transporter substrate-binding protein [unclassified Mesorhizobium]|uniref:ABC transporter substrate-binding protein n=1 Tax=unclassified Mesorhizobium TaxID=325217 RepID=UPI000F74E7CC|nr:MULTISPECIES: ABC transporter substrate-binding protein [unclassified Mesorhizobium]RUX10374.1 ABC transporter substrate-binding protein [Mesorhizobium sp. M8A.F.Ca.ET.059.01.1.1]AZO52359.1 ABC transporter substrate-binding protein [Mesorhizobium sp. M8A.F.Ca.ET.057.01.1.1]RWE38467.1 MAG: ABC transporter substrate-binding protein [Mesorhizobium sp.]RWE40995.1 MAG: ABC transporter substrate-binding protein [Mesorhizobium sp.]RWP14627.1 MAG: ABC transporter substrate-binding protein [Mesorhiz
MTICRRDLIKMGLAAGAAISIPSVLRAQAASGSTPTVRMVKANDLRIFDPIFSATNVTADHGLAIYDTLFGVDSKFMPQPQMVGKWSVSEDRKTYTFELRDGLVWHDDTPVTAADCVASIRRWGQVAPGGQLVMERASDISKKDDKTFVISLKEPLGILVDLLADLTPPCLFIMREKDASRPATEQVTTNVGSGPFRFNEALVKPGASYTYDRNEKYIPRQEPADGLAGGKIVKIDRIIWDNISDPQTAFAALQAGEIDYVEEPPNDLVSVIESDPNLVVDVLDKSGKSMLLRLNCLQKPFDNVKSRQAMLHLIDQEAFMNVLAPKFGRSVTSIFGGDTLYSNDENTGWYKKGGDPEKAKQLFKEAGYAGEKIVVLQATDWAPSNDGSQLLAAALHNIGIDVELAPSDWGGLSTRRAKKDPVENGGWSMFITSEADFSLANPLATPLLLANGENAWYGWPKNDEYEALRAKWPSVATLEERKALARQMQGLWWDFVGDVRLGHYVSPMARRKTLTGLIGMPQVVPMWNMQKA